MYFPCSRKQFGLPGPSLLEVGHDEREQDGMLASALMVRCLALMEEFLLPLVGPIDFKYFIYLFR